MVLELLLADDDPLPSAHRTALIKGVVGLTDSPRDESEEEGEGARQPVGRQAPRVAHHRVELRRVRKAVQSESAPSQAGPTQAGHREAAASRRQHRASQQRVKAVKSK